MSDSFRVDGEASPLNAIHTTADVTDADSDDLSASEELAQIRHDLMTPLNQIIGYTEIMIEEAEDMAEDSLVPDLHRVRNASNTLVLLINEYFGVPTASPDETKAVAAPRVPPPTLTHAVVKTVSVSGTESAEAAHPALGQSRLLVVDDLEANRDVLARRLKRQGHYVVTANDGREALERLRTEPFDLVLLDVLMPEMDGYQLLQHLKQDETLRHIPVIMISAIGELDSVVRCIELGAEDYLPKPFNPILLRARIGACLEKKRLRDREQAYLEQISIERAKADRLLLNILPEAIAQRLKADETLIADYYEDVTILFADIVGFTELAGRIPPDALIGHLNAVFSVFDRLVDDYGLEKIKTIGDAYMVVGGLPLHRKDHIEAVAAAACAMCAEMESLQKKLGLDLTLRIGIHAGSVVAGVIGTKKFAYDLWGDAVNIANRMQIHGAPGRIHVSGTVRERLAETYDFEERGEIEIRGKGTMQTAFLLGRKSSS